MATIYRYKFSPDFVKKLLIFTDIHRYDEIPIFREAWLKWLEENISDILVEERRLLGLGYKGNVRDKMYKSVRYYYKNKDTTASSPKKRRNYCRVSSKVLEAMDKHIREKDEKPSVSFHHFIETHGALITEAKVDLGDVKDIDLKIKKTYKNRYFRINNNN